MNRKNNREKWRERVRRWKRGGLTARQFAEQMGLNHKTLLWWSWQLRREAKGGDKASEQTKLVRFIDFTETVSRDKTVVDETVLHLEISDVLVKVPVGFDEQTLRRVLLVIRQP